MRSHSWAAEGSRSVDRIAPDRRLAKRLFVASFLALVAATICYLVMVRTFAGQRLDQVSYLWANDHKPSHVVDGLLRRITGDSFIVALILLVGLGVVRRRRVLGIGAALAAALAVVVTHVLKNDILTRPESTLNTFPSGHTATAVGCAMALVLVCPPRWRGLAALSAGAGAVIIAVGVQVAGWHRPSDAVGGALLAFASVTAVAGVLAWARPLERATTSGQWIPLLVLGAGGSIAAVVTALRCVWELDALRLGDVHAVVRHDAYLTGLIATTGIVCLLLLALLLLLGSTDLGATDRGKDRSSD